MCKGTTKLCRWGPKSWKVYVGDHIVLCIRARSEASSLHVPDRDLVAASHRAYQKFGVERSVGKAVGFCKNGPCPRAALSFVICGTQTDFEG